ncbi:uncharacterized protein [Hemitrygon akajei]|uniref:uncharacterized protein n=1 Tax=Hemitrygon akajei TaxID=2704970 RepID=UPI003BF954E3
MLTFPSWAVIFFFVLIRSGGLSAGSGSGEGPRPLGRGAGGSDQSLRSGTDKIHAICGERFIGRKAYNWKQTTTEDKGRSTSEPARGLTASTGQNPSDSGFPVIQLGESLIITGRWSISALEPKCKQENNNQESSVGIKMATGGKLNRVQRVFKSLSLGASSSEDDRDTGNNAPKQGQIESNVPVEYSPATEEGEQSQPRDSDVRDTDQDPGTSTSEGTACQLRSSLNTELSNPQQGAEQQKLITPVLKMGQGASRVGVPVTSASERDKGPSSVITELLASWDDSQLLQLTDIYRDRLEQAMEGGVHGVSLALTAENQFSGEEHRKISDLADKGERADSSKFLLSLVMEKGSRAPRVMWETFVKMWNCVPNLFKILKEIQIYGCDPSHRPIPAQHLLTFLSELKDVQQKHKETLRAQTETLRVNTILMREKVKVFQLIDRYAELTVISTVRDRRLVEHELLARGRDHEELREKHLHRKLKKLRTDQLFQSSFSRSKSKSGSSAAVAGVPGIGKTTMNKPKRTDSGSVSLLWEFPERNLEEPKGISVHIRWFG